MRLISTLISFFFLIVLVTFVTHNTVSVDLDFWPFDVKITLPISLMALIFFALGCMLGLMITLPRLWKNACEKRKLAKEIKNLKKEKAQKNVVDMTSEPKTSLLYRLTHKEHS